MVSLVNDENHLLIRQSWSPLGYEDLGNPHLASSVGLVGRAERTLLERLRTSIDQILLSFARRERRRLSPVSVGARPDIVDAQIADRSPSLFNEWTGVDSLPEEALENPPPPVDLSSLLPPIELTRFQGVQPIAEQPRVEDKKRPRKRKPRPVKRVSRYKRDPVI